MTAGRALVVGGTGMLADATRWLARQGWDITLMARRPDALAADLNATPVAFDWDAPDGVRGLQPGYDLALLWLHDTAVPLARQFEDLLRPEGRVVRVHGSLSADPEVRAAREPDPRPGLARQTVILGWHPGPDGGRTWLSHREISTGTAFALAHPDRSWVQIGACAGQGYVPPDAP